MHRNFKLMTLVLLVAGVAIGADRPNKTENKKRMGCEISKQIADVRCFGAAGDGKTDDTGAIEAAFQASHSIRVPDGVYLINCDATPDKTWVSGGILPQSDSTINFAPHAVLKCKPNRTGHYVALRLKDVTNIHIVGGTLDGSRDSVSAPNTEWGFGIGCWGCQHITLESVTAINFWGDGFYFNSSSDHGHTVPASDIQAKRLVARNNRRNGASFISVLGWKCVECRFEFTAGTAPQAGVDIEPGGDGIVRDWECDNCEFTNNGAYGIAVGGFSGPLIENVKLIGGRA